MGDCNEDSNTPNDDNRRVTRSATKKSKESKRSDAQDVVAQAVIEGREPDLNLTHSEAELKIITARVFRHMLLTAPTIATKLGEAFNPEPCKEETDYTRFFNQRRVTDNTRSIKKETVTNNTRSIKKERVTDDTKSIKKERVTDDTISIKKERVEEEPKSESAISQIQVKEEIPTPPSSRSGSPEPSTPRLTFLESLTANTDPSISDPEAVDFRKNFGKKKNELIARLFKLFNEEIFENGLPKDMSITWNKHFRVVSGKTKLKIRTSKNGVVTRFARIMLCQKAIDRAERLRDVLIHEMCHAASWLIDGVRDDHGPGWKNWTRKAQSCFPELPVIKRTVGFDVAKKYVYKCEGCGNTVKRCSKSLDTTRCKCGKCHGKFTLFISKRKQGDDEVPEFELIPAKKK